jgi:hypothetical protein
MMTMTIREYVMEQLNAHLAGKGIQLVREGEEKPKPALKIASRNGVVVELKPRDDEDVGI